MRSEVTGVQDIGELAQPRPVSRSAQCGEAAGSVREEMKNDSTARGLDRVYRQRSRKKRRLKWSSAL